MEMAGGREVARADRVFDCLRRRFRCEPLTLKMSPAKNQQMTAAASVTSRNTVSVLIQVELSTVSVLPQVELSTVAVLPQVELSTVAVLPQVELSTVSVLI